MGLKSLGPGLQIYPIFFVKVVERAEFNSLTSSLAVRMKPNRFSGVDFGILTIILVLNSKVTSPTAVL